MTRTAAAGALLAAFTPACVAQTPSLISLHGQPGEPVGYTGYGCTPDGSVVVGLAQQVGGTGPFRWTPSNMFVLGVPSGTAYAVSADGTVVAGDAGSTFRWTAPTGLVHLLPLSGFSGGHFAGMTADGSTIIGNATGPGSSHAPFRWTAAGTTLLTIPGATNPYVRAISPDGRVIVGTGFSGPGGFGAAFRMEDGVVTDLIGNTSGLSFDPVALNSNGTLIVGDYYEQSTGRNRIFLWKQGVPNFIAVPRYYSPGGNCAAYAVSDAGLVFGFSGDYPIGGVICVWSESLPIQKLSDYLAARGVPGAASSTFTLVGAVTADGKTIVGSGTIPGTSATAFRAQLCYADCDDSTTQPLLNVGDFSCFLQRFAASDAYANCDHSTAPPVLNVLDFTCFLQKFAAGCS